MPVSLGVNRAGASAHPSPRPRTPRDPESRLWHEHQPPRTAHWRSSAFAWKPGRGRHWQQLLRALRVRVRLAAAEAAHARHSVAAAAPRAGAPHQRPPRPAAAAASGARLGPTSGPSPTRSPLRTRSVHRSSLYLVLGQMHHNLSAMAGERRVLPGRSEQVHCRSLPMSAKTKLTKTKTAVRQGTYNPSLSDLKHDLHCGFVELGESVSVSKQHHRLKKP
jgi:hypothetical protein